MKIMSGDNTNAYKLIEPNFQSKEELISHLEHRCIKIDNMGRMSKEQLVELYSRIVTPLEQRITRRTAQSPTSNQEGIPMDCMESSEYLNKRMKFMHTNQSENIVNNHNINLKRKTNDIRIADDATPVKKARQRICWP